MLRNSLLSVVFVLLSIQLLPAAEEGSAQQRGLEIAEAADRWDAGFGNYTADMEMILRNRHGQESRRRLHIRVLEVVGDGDNNLFIFDHPPDVRGTVMLTHSHGEDPDDQWLYLPALKRVKRIASRNKSGPFMGSEFAYEDLSSQEVAKYRYHYLGDETFANLRCHLLERRPVAKNSGYLRQLVWIEPDAYRVLKIEYYNRKDLLLKTLEMTGYKEYLGHYWRPDRMLVTNHQTGKSTLLEWSGYRFRSGLRAQDFHPKSLERLR